MQRRTLLPAIALMAFAPLFVAAQQASTGTPGKNRQKLVIQMSDGDQGKWNLALNNAKNVQDDLGAANVDIEIVAYGPGIGMLKMDSPASSRVGEAIKAGIKVVACENTMRAQQLAKDDMHPAISYATAGVTEIMRLQQAGWSYIRP
jgi:intracellular sulfur oxidation DsrE/DsrF family protein